MGKVGNSVTNSCFSSDKQLDVTVYIYKLTMLFNLCDNLQVPSYIRKGRDVKVDMSKKHVKVSHKDETGQFKVVVDGGLTWEVQTEESMWTLNPGENVHVSFFLVHLFAPCDYA